MAHLRKWRKDYQVRWSEHGKERSRVCASLAVARELLREVQRSEDLGEPYQPRGLRAEPALAEVAQAWMRDLTRLNEASTIEQHAHRIDLFGRWLRTRHPRGIIGVSLLYGRVLADYHAELDGFDGKERAEVTRNKYVRTIAALWRWAFEEDEIGTFVQKPKTMRLRAPPAPATRALTWADIDRVIAQAHGRHRQLLVVLRYTGLRVDQAMRLLWSDVDLDRGTLYVRPELGKTRAEKAGRELPLSSHLIAELAGWGQRIGHLVPGGEKRSREGRGRDVWRFFERAEIDPSYWRQRPHHCFRIAFVSGCKAAGCDSDAVEYYVGHDLQIRGTYTGAWALKLRGVADAIPAIGSMPVIPSMTEQARNKDERDGGASAISKAVRR